MPVRLIIFVLFFIVGTAATPVHASGFQLTSIGSMNVDGVTYSHLYYSSGDVTFSGIGVPGNTVTADIDGNAGSTTVGDDGNWSYQATLAEGDHTLTFTSDAGSVSLTLTIGVVPENVGSLPAAETPTAGSVEPTLILISAAVFLMLSPVLLKRYL